MDYERVEQLVRELLIQIGEDPGREGLVRTPHRIAAALDCLCSGYRAAVIIEAQHLCMMMRGVEKQNSMMATSSVLGSFREPLSTRNESLTLIAKPRPQPARPLRMISGGD